MSDKLELLKEMAFDLEDHDTPNLVAWAVEEIQRLRADLHHLRGLLETAADAWESGQAVIDRDGTALADFRGACLTKAWYVEATKAGGDDE